MGGMTDSSRDLFTSASDDIASIITGLPVGTLRRLALASVLWRLPWVSSAYFLDWELRDWPKIYYREVSRCLMIHHHGTRLMLPQVPLLLWNAPTGTNIFVDHRSEPFVLAEDIRAMTEESLKLQKRFYRLWRRKYTNETNLRLKGIEFTNGEESTLVVQGVKYEDYVRTNLGLDVKYSGQQETLRQRVHPDGKLEELSQSPLGNSTGIGTLLFTADGKLIMQKRSWRVAIRPGELAPSSSGTLTYTDVPAGTRVALGKLPKLRETFEELGLGPTDIRGEIMFLGLTRELIRGGQPELFFFGFTGLSENDVRARFADAEDKFESRRIVFYDFGNLAFDELKTDDLRHDFLSRLDGLIDQYRPAMSVPLWTSLALWRERRLAGNGI